VNRGEIKKAMMGRGVLPTSSDPYADLEDVYREEGVLRLKHFNSPSHGTRTNYAKVAGSVHQGKE
jgi:hypothetical protein